MRRIFSTLQIDWRTPTPDARLDLDAIQRQLSERALPTAGRAPGEVGTGGVVGSVDLPGGALGTPMPYMHEGRQYVALTVGGEVPELIALALPRSP